MYFISVQLCVCVCVNWEKAFDRVPREELPYNGNCCMLVVIAETKDDLIKRLNEWKDNVKDRVMRVNINKTKVMISE